jgi:hypothetical protein
MQTKIASAVISLVSTVASAQAAPPPDPNAQPASAPAAPYGEPGHRPSDWQPSGPPGCGPWQPCGPQLQLQQLSPEDQALLARGEISGGPWIAGGLVSFFVGFGLGQSVEGRWGDKGWIFTLGDAASVTTLAVGAVDAVGCIAAGSKCNPTGTDVLLFGGAIGLVLFRAWETVDAFAAPPAQNARIRALRTELGLPQQQGYAWAPYIAPAHSLRGDTTVAGLQLRF